MENLGIETGSSCMQNVTRTTELCSPFLLGNERQCGRVANLIPPSATTSPSPHKVLEGQIRRKGSLEMEHPRNI